MTLDIDQIEQKCAHFAMQWDSGVRPCIEEYIDDAPDPTCEALVAKLLALELKYRRSHGERPTLFEYSQRFPQFETIVAAAFAEEPQPGSTRSHSPDSSLAASPQAIFSQTYPRRCPACRTPVESSDGDNHLGLMCASCGLRFSGFDENDDTWQRPVFRRLGQFELIEELGSGAFGTVWKARDTKLERIVAIKVPHSNRVRPADLEYFFREARAAAQLRHPNIVSVHEVGRDGDTVFIVSDIIRGVTLSDFLATRMVKPSTAAEICAKVADALHHAHQRGVIHRDLKSGNILIDGSGEPHLLDFGLAKREEGEETLTAADQVLGTPAYMSPEQAAGKAHQVDRRTDIYSLGVVLYQLLTGELPFRGTPRMLLHQVISEPPRPPRSLNENVPRDLETICLKALEKDPADRFATGQEIADDLRRWLSDLPILTRPLSTAERLIRWILAPKRSHDAGVLGLSLSSIALLFLFMWSIHAAFVGIEVPRFDEFVWQGGLINGIVLVGAVCSFFIMRGSRFATWVALILALLLIVILSLSMGDWMPPPLRFRAGGVYDDLLVRTAVFSLMLSMLVGQTFLLGCAVAGYRFGKQPGGG